MKKTKVGLLLIFIMCFSIFASSFFADVNLSADTLDVWDGTVATNFAGGDGSEDNPYQISTGGELAYLSSSVNNGETYYGKYFILTNDIDLNGKEWTVIGKEGVSLGQDYSFKGSFDGQNHTIFNLYLIYDNYFISNNTFCGLFGNVKGDSDFRAKISNLKVDTPKISYVASGSTSQDNYIGIVVAKLTNADIFNCSVINTSLEADTYNINIENSLGVKVGGIVGELNNSTATYCGSCAKILLSHSKVEYFTYVGGITGAITTSSTSIENCYYEGEMTLASMLDSISTQYVGGMVGWISAANTSILNCYARYNALTNYTNVHLSGIIGNVYDSKSVTISKCYFYGDLNNDYSSYDYSKCSAILTSDNSDMSNINASYCYYNYNNSNDKFTSGQLIENDSDWASQSTFDGFDFELVWEILSSNNYPTLRAYKEPPAFKLVYSDNSYNYYDELTTDLISAILNSNSNMQLFLLKDVKIEESVEFETSQDVTLSILSFEDNVFNIKLSSLIKFKGDIDLQNIDLTIIENSNGQIVNDNLLDFSNCTITYKGISDYVFFNSENASLSLYNVTVNSQSGFATNFKNAQITLYSCTLQCQSTVFYNYGGGRIYLNAPNDQYLLANTISLNTAQANYFIFNNQGLGVLSLSTSTVINNNNDVDIKLNAISNESQNCQIEVLDSDNEISLNVSVDKTLFGEGNYYIAKSVLALNKLTLVSKTDGVFSIKNGQYNLFTTTLQAYLSKNWKSKLPFSLDKVIDIEFVTSNESISSYDNVLIGAKSDFVSDVDADDVIENIICYYSLNDNNNYSLKIYSKAKIICPNDSSELFSGFENLESLQLLNLDLDNVTIFDRMFADLLNLQTLDLSNIKINDITSSSEVFDNCNNLYEIISPTITKENVRIGLNSALNYYKVNSEDVLDKSTKVEYLDKNTQNFTIKSAFELSIDANGGSFDETNTTFTYSNNIARKLYFYDETVSQLPSVAQNGFTVSRIKDENDNNFTTGGYILNDVSLTVEWTARTDIEFLVELYRQNLENLTEYTKDNNAYNLYGATGEEIVTEQVNKDNLNNSGNFIKIKTTYISIPAGFEYYSQQYYVGENQVYNAIVNANNKLVIKIYVNRKSYNVSINKTTSTNGGGANGGNVSFNESQNIVSTTALFGQNITLYFTYNVGYELKNLNSIIDGIANQLITEKQILESYTFNEISSDVVFNAEFELLEVSVTLTNVQNGNLSFVDENEQVINVTNSTLSVYYGGKAIVKATANQDYKFKYFTVSSSQEHFNNNPLTIENIISDISVSANFVAVYDVSFVFDDTKGQITVSGSSVANNDVLEDIEEGTSLNLVFTPSDSHNFCNYVKINGQIVNVETVADLNAKTYTLVVSRNSEIEVEFDREKLVVQFTSNISSISTLSVVDLDLSAETTNSSFYYGTNLSFRVSNIESGYRIKQWKVNNNIVKDSQNEIVTQTQIDYEITTALNVQVEFEILVSIIQTQNGQISVNDELTELYVDYNQTVSIEIIANRGYELSAYLYDLVGNALSYEFTKTVTEPVTYGCEFSSKKLNITTNFNNDAGRVQLSSQDDEYIINSEIEFKIIENAGYKFKNYTISYKNDKYNGTFDVESKLQNYIVTIDDVENEEIIVTANFEMITYNVILDVSKGGHIECDKLQDNQIRFTYFEDVEITIVADDLHKLNAINKIKDNQSESLKGQIVNSKYILDKDTYLLKIEFIGITWLDDGIRANKFSQGIGSQDNPFVISTPNELGLMAYLINNGRYNQNTGIYYNKAYYKLSQNISLMGNYWIPIGISSQNCRFEGVFDYQYHKIINSLVEDESIETIEDNVFGVCFNAKFINKEQVNYLLIIGIVSTCILAFLIVIAIIIKKKMDKKPKRVIVIPPKEKKDDAPRFNISNEIPRPNFDNFNKKK